MRSKHVRVLNPYANSSQTWNLCHGFCLVNFPPILLDP
jgi:hypothetical protein